MIVRTLRFGYGTPIRPLIRELDRYSTIEPFDLWRYAQSHTRTRSSRLSSCIMPCNGPRLEASVDLLRQWVAGGPSGERRGQMTGHVVRSTYQTVRFWFLDPTAAPVARIRSGSSVTFPDTCTHWGNEGTYAMTFAGREPLRHKCPDGPYSMVEPVHVKDPEPSVAIECAIEQPTSTLLSCTISDSTRAA